jgi:DNA-binding NtrC family response regulator
MSPLDAVLDRPVSASPATAFLASSQLRVLVADDQRDVVEALRLLLSTHGLAVVPALSPAEALASTAPVDAALVDLNYDNGRTSGEQGLDLLTALQRRHPGLPIVAMTAWSTIEIALEAIRRGARDFVEKPWDDSRLVVTVRAQAELGRALHRIAQLESEVQTLREHGAAAAPVDHEMKLLQVEGTLVRRAMDRHQGNVSRAARTLGLSRSALYRRLERHKIRTPESEN